GRGSRAGRRLARPAASYHSALGLSVLVSSDCMVMDSDYVLYLSVWLQPSLRRRMESGLKATAVAGRNAALERRTRGALAFGGACLAALWLRGLAVLPAPGLFSVVVLCSYGLIAGTVLAKITAFHPHDRF